MALGVIARKIGMSRVFLPTGESIAVTYLKVEDNTVVRTKTKERDGYSAIVLGIGEHIMRTRKAREIKKYSSQKEFTLESLDGHPVGHKVTAEALPVDSLVTVVGVSKGKGFQGAMKLHHFSGGPASHGSHFKREPGSVGMRTWPGRIHAGKRMAAHMGSETITIKNRPVMVCDTQKKIIGIKGAVPGANGSIVFVTLETGTAKKEPKAPVKPSSKK